MKRILSIILSVVMLLSTSVVFAEEPKGDGTPPRYYTFEELTGLSREDIDHIVIRSGIDGVGYSTAYDKIITDIYNFINTKSFTVYNPDDNKDGWSYQILFFDKNNKGSTYTISNGIVVPEISNLTFRTSNEPSLEIAVEKAYRQMALDCTNWGSDYIVEANDLGITEDITKEEAKKNVTRGEFSEYLSRLLRKKGILINCENESAFSDVALTHPYYKDIIYLKRLSIIKGVGSDEFRPGDNITFQEAAAMFSRIFLTDSDVNVKYGPYPEGYIKYALNSGLFEGIPADGEEYITHNDSREIIKKLEGYFITYDLIEKLGCDAYNGEVYIDYYPKSWQGFEEEPVAATNGYFRILPGKLLYSYDNENWHTLYEDIDGKRVYSNLPENIDISGARYEWAYDCFVNAPFDVNKSYYSYDNKVWLDGEPKNADASEFSLDTDEFIMGIKKESIIYDSDSGLYFSCQPYYESPYYSKIHKTVFTDIRYNVIWVSDDAKKWIAIMPPDDVLFFTNAGLNRGADRKANGIIINGAVNFTAEEKAFLDNEEKIAADLGLDYDKPAYKTEKYILHFSDVKELFQ